MITLIMVFRSRLKTTRLIVDRSVFFVSDCQPTYKTEKILITQTMLLRSNFRKKKIMFLTLMTDFL